MKATSGVPRSLWSGDPSIPKSAKRPKISVLITLSLLLGTTPQAPAQDQGHGARASWLLGDGPPLLVIPLVGILTKKQKQMIHGGFTTVSTLSITRERGSDEASPAPSPVPSWDLSCTVKFDAWDEVYDVTRIRAAGDQSQSESTVLRQFKDYGEWCLEVKIPTSHPLLRDRTPGRPLLGQLTLRQMSPAEGAKIKEWLVEQQTGIMQSLFKHMLGELALEETLRVLIPIPPLPAGIPESKPGGDAKI